MTTIYECDITGKQYKRENKVREVGLSDDNGLWTKFEFGPDATIDEVRERLHDEVDEFEPFHQDWWDEKTDTYNPPHIVEEEIKGQKCAITVPTVQQ